MKYRVPIIGSGATQFDARRPAHQNLLGPIWTRLKEFDTDTHCVVEVLRFDDSSGARTRVPCEAPGHSVLIDMPGVDVFD
jgi:hypothetical protein